MADNIQYIAKDVMTFSTHRAPEEFRSIPEIAEAYPKDKNCYKRLQEHDGLKEHIVQWFVSFTGGVWVPEGPIFVVQGKRIKGRGMNYRNARKQFILDNLEEAKNIYLGVATEEENASFINKARKAIEYSPTTASVDIFRFLQRTFHSLNVK